MSGAAGSKGGPLESLVECCDLSWVARLEEDPETKDQLPNNTSRQVRSGHYVRVRPAPLPNPVLVCYSEAMANSLGLTSVDCETPEFAAYFSGDIPKPESDGSAEATDAAKAWGTTWATPYALSIYGREMYDNCPFGNGNGYGDGRAISVGEVLRPDGPRWEMQLKGAGPTPFCRGGDGRAVLRSSVREFLVSEAMHHLGVSTTRALSLVASSTETVGRPWYTNRHQMESDVSQDPRIQAAPPHLRAMFVQALQEQFKSPDVMQDEICANTCRVAPSFLRVGHVELFGRRAHKANDEGSVAYKQLVQIAEHALFREYPECDVPEASLEDKVLLMVSAVSTRLAELTANWIRVGFCQGNFNSDNCLVGGRTMDYGPFGFLEKFSPLWNMWVGGGDHFGFLNQPVAGGKNLGSLAHALAPLVSASKQNKLEELVDKHTEVVAEVMHDMWTAKLGLLNANIEAETSQRLKTSLLALMEETQADYTIFWRQLAHLPANHVAADAEPQELLEPFNNAFYAPLSDKASASLVEWLRTWRAATAVCDDAEVAALMRSKNPKYVPREWMLVEAYTAANDGDYQAIKDLHRLFLNPYDEQPDMERFYQKTPAETYKGVGRAGTAFMS